MSLYMNTLVYSTLQLLPNANRRERSFFQTSSKGKNYESKRYEFEVSLDIGYRHNT